MQEADHREPKKILVIYLEDDFFEKSYKGKQEEYHKYLDDIQHHILDHLANDPKLAMQVGEISENPIELSNMNIAAFVEYMMEDMNKLRRQANSNVNLNMRNYNYNSTPKFRRKSKNMKDRYCEIPIFVVDSDGLNTDKIIRILREKQRERNTQLVTRLAGGYEFFDHLFGTYNRGLVGYKGGLFGKFGIVIQSPNLEAAKFNGFKPGVKLECPKDVKQSRFGIRKIGRKGWRNQPNDHWDVISTLCEEMAKKHKFTLTDPPELRNAICKSKELDDFTCSLYVTKKGAREKTQKMKHKELKPLQFTNIEIFECKS